MLVNVVVAERVGDKEVVKLNRNVGIMEVDALLYTVDLPVRAESLELFLSRSAGNCFSFMDKDTRYVFRAA